MFHPVHTVCTRRVHFFKISALPVLLLNPCPAWLCDHWGPYQWYHEPNPRHFSISCWCGLSGAPPNSRGTVINHGYWLIHRGVDLSLWVIADIVDGGTWTWVVSPGSVSSWPSLQVIGESRFGPFDGYEVVEILSESHSGQGVKLLAKSAVFGCCLFFAILNWEIWQGQDVQVTRSYKNMWMWYKSVQIWEIVIQTSPVGWSWLVMLGADWDQLTIHCGNPRPMFLRLCESCKMFEFVDICWHVLTCSCFIPRFFWPLHSDPAQSLEAAAENNEECMWENMMEDLE